VQFEEYQRHLAALKYGKRLPTAIYVFRQADTDFGRELNPITVVRIVSQKTGINQVN